MMRKAMLLAAGRGQRLQALTEHTPKPLLSVGGTTLIEHNICQLKASGVQDIVINVCYLAQHIIDHLGDGSRYGVRIQYSWEEGERALETGGGVYRALPLLGDEPFWVVSADIWTEYAFPEICLDLSTDAHCIMVPNPDFHPQGDYGLDAQGRLVAKLRGAQGGLYTYGNIALMRAALFQDIQTDYFPLSQVIHAGITRCRIGGSLYTGPWFNVGDAQQLERLSFFLGDL